jgi:hypothetical protein
MRLRHRKRAPAQMLPVCGVLVPVSGFVLRNRPRTAAIRAAETTNDTALAANAPPAPATA